MNKDNSKIIMISFLCAAALVAVITNVLFATLSVAFSSVAQLYSNEAIKHGLPAALALLTFILLVSSKKTKNLADEVVTSTRKVVWASRKDVTAMTIVTCIMLVISCVILATFDFISTEAVKMLLS